MSRAWNDYFLGGIWLSALGLAALADRAAQTRLAGGDPAADLALGQTFCWTGASRPRDGVGRAAGGSVRRAGAGWPGPAPSTAG